MASRRGERRKMKKEWKSQFKKNDVFLTKIEKLSLFNCTFRSVPLADEFETETMNNIWKTIGNPSNMTKLICQYFATFSDHYWSLLKLLKGCHNHFYKSSFDGDTRDYSEVSQLIVWEFQKLEEELADSSPCEDVRMASFQLLSNLDAGFLFEDANCIFHFDAQPRLYVNFIAHLVHLRKYKLAGQWVVMLELQSHFKPTDIALPLLIEGEIESMEDYLDGESQNNRISFVKLCDQLCNEKKSLEQITLKLNIKNPKITECRQLARAIQHLPGQYQIPLERLLNLKSWFNVFLVDHLIHYQYRRGLYEEEDWEYFLTEVVHDNVGFQMEALRLIAINKRDMHRAIQLAKKWKTPRLRIHPDITKAMQSHQEFTVLPFPRLKDRNNYYDAKLPNIVWVSKTSEYEKCIKFISKSKIVGLKCEFKRKFAVDGRGSIIKTSILQIATPENVYLLDMIVLKSALSVNDWRKLIVKVFANSSICKLVFDFDDEWSSLTAVCSLAFHNVTFRTKCFIDLHCLTKAMMDRNLMTQETDDLDSLVHCCFKFSLNRSEEISNWEKRPLRETQQQYAALGAFCLLQVYKHLEQQCSQYQIDFDEIVELSKQIQLNNLAL